MALPGVSGAQMTSDKAANDLEERLAKLRNA